MKLIKVACLILLFCCVEASAWSQSIKDSRDGKIYETQTIGSNDWFAEDLRYSTESSWCAEHLTDTICNSTNFYRYIDLPRVCPPGWRLPNKQEWFDMIDVLTSNNDTLEWKTMTFNKKHPPGHIMHTNLLKTGTPLGLEPYGWIQGKKRVVKYEQANYWILDNSAAIPAHVHVSNGRQLLHTHEHHIKDKKRKVRRFQVRCVR